MPPSPPPAPPTPHCPLLGLPPELRNRIYDLVLISKREVLIKDTFSPPLLRTYRQIEAEASSIYYSQNLFIVTNAETLTLAWPKSLPAGMRDLIKTFRLYVSHKFSWVNVTEHKHRLLCRLKAEIRRQNLGRQLKMEIAVGYWDGKERWTSDPLSFGTPTFTTA